MTGEVGGTQIQIPESNHELLKKKLKNFLSPEGGGEGHLKNCIKKLCTKFHEATISASILKYVNNMNRDT